MQRPSDDEEQIFFAAIGEAVSEWTNVERQLLEVFLIVLDSNHPRAAAAAYYANINFRTKLDFVDRAVVARLSQPDIPDKPNAWYLKFDHPLLPAWSALERRLRKKASKRGNVAHFEKIVMGSEFALVPPTDNPLNLVAPSKWDGGLTTQKIKAITGEFRDIATAIHDFNSDLLKSIGQPSKSL